MSANSNSDALKNRLDGRKMLEKFLLNKCRSDQAFAQELLKHPKRTIENIVNMNLPEEIEVKILTGSEEDLLVILPLKPPDFAEPDAARTHESDIINADQHYHAWIIQSILSRLNGQLTQLS